MLRKVKFRLLLFVVLLLFVYIYSTFFFNFYAYSGTGVAALLWLFVFSGISLLITVASVIIKKSLINIQLVSISVLLALIAGEYLLRTRTEKYKSYSEQNGEKKYVSPYSVSSTNRYHTHIPGTTVTEAKGEFTYSYNINSLGISEREIVESDTQFFRIACLGDSYTQGVGAPSDSCWSRQLENILGSYDGKPVQTINCGISGSDLVYQYKLLADKIMPYKPGMVILCLNSTDITDLIVRGGLERYANKKKEIILPKTPWWEPFFAVSYIVRAVAIDVFRVSFLLLSPNDSSSSENLALEKLKEALQQLYTYTSQQQSIAFYLVLLPTPHDYYKNDYSLLEKQAYRVIPKENVINIKEEWKESVSRQSLDDWYWPIDCHLKANGYKYLANTIAHKLVGDSSSLSEPGNRFRGEDVK